MLRVAAITLIVLGGCAAPRAGQSQSQARLETGVHVEAPAGALDYCRRAPDECGALVAGLRGRLAPTGAARLQEASAEAGAPSLFHALMLQRAAGGARAELGPRVEVEMTPARLRELSRINREVNRAIGAATDTALYGADEFWVRPLQVSARGARGDCEDYALEKRAMLIGAGWPAEALAMAVAISPRVGLHAVLIVQTDQGDVALDNLFDRPMPVDALGYHWISRQASASLGEWTSAHLSAPISPAATARALPADRFHAMLEARARREGARAQQEIIVAPVDAPRLIEISAQGEAPGLRALNLSAARELGASSPRALQSAPPALPKAPVRAGKPSALHITHRLMRIHLDP